jgi:hypothetical protein
VCYDVFPLSIKPAPEHATGSCLRSCDVDLDRWEMPPRGERRYGKDQKPPEVRGLRDEDWKDLPLVFRGAFGQWPPLSQWNATAALRASKCIVDWARVGRDGPVVESACSVAVTREETGSATTNGIVGAAIVTLVPAERLRGAGLSEGISVPHLDWIFVPWRDQRHGTGTLLLERVVKELRLGGLPHAGEHRARGKRTGNVVALEIRISAPPKQQLNPN